MITVKELIYDSSFRTKVAQGLAIIVVFGTGYYLYSNIVNNLQQMDLPFGFGFIGSTAGFDIGWSIVPYDPSMSYGRVYLVGILNTLILSILVIFFSTLLGFVVGIMRLSHNLVVAQLARWFVEFIRNVPQLIQIIFWFVVVFSTLPGPRQGYSFLNSFFLNNRGFYLPAPVFEANFSWTLMAIVVATICSFFLHKWSRNYQRQSGQRKLAYRPALFVLVILVGVVFVSTGKPLHWTVPTLQGFNFQDGFYFPIAFMAAFISMTIYHSAPIAEMVRAGIQSIDSGQREAAIAIGFPPFKTLRLVVIPQAARAILPPMINTWLTTVKDSSLAVAVGFPELVSVYMQTSLNQTGRAIEIVIMVMGFYMMTSLLISFLLNLYNQRIQLKEG